MNRKLPALGLLLLFAGCAGKPAPAPAPAAVPIPTPPAPRAEPPAFNGLSTDALRARLGTPAFSRKDGATEMWRYDAGACHVFFFFAAGKIAHVETIPRSGDAATDPACLNALRKTP